jgi:hypothetical protein
LVATDGPWIYTYAAPSTNAPALNLATGGGNAFVSWPSAGFVRQQNSNLATTNWVNVSGAPAVVNQMIAPETGSNNFYRLVQP